MRTMTLTGNESGRCAGKGTKGTFRAWCLAGLLCGALLLPTAAPAKDTANSGRQINDKTITRAVESAVSLIKIANDIRHLGSGPRCGLGELKLPATQPGSSIMLGKVNPAMCEMVMQVGAQVIGNDATIIFGAASGNFELNTMMPVIAHNLLQSVELLTNASRAFTPGCVAGLQADGEHCQSNIERSLAMVTALAPGIGYDQAAKISKIAHETGRTVREVALEMAGLPGARLDRLLDPRRQTKPTAD